MKVDSGSTHTSCGCVPKSVDPRMPELMCICYTIIPFHPGFADAALEFGFQHYGFKKEVIDTPEFYQTWHSASSMTVNMFSHLRDIRTKY